MKATVKTPKKYIALYLIFALFFCAVLAWLIAIGAKTSDIHGENETEISSESDTEKYTGPVVVIDAGHGGEDGGTVGKNGVYEKDINLSVSLYLADELKNAGVEVLLTRSEDILLYDRNSNYEGQKKVQDLAERRRIAESCENALFVSIHMNSFPEERYKGLQVYYSENNGGSSALAELIRNTVKQSLQPDNTRQNKTGENIYLLDRLSCPAVLVECGFLSNPEECALLSSTDYQKALAKALAKAITEYINASE